MPVRTRILQDVAEYAIRTADREAGGDGPRREPPIAEPPDLPSRSDRTSAHLMSDSASALEPWAVFALSFLILPTDGEAFDGTADMALNEAIGLDGLGELSRLLANQSERIPMFGQAARSAKQLATVNVDDMLDASSFGSGPHLSGPKAGPYTVALLPDAIFDVNLEDSKNGLTPLTPDALQKDLARVGHMSSGQIGPISRPVDAQGDGGDGLLVGTNNDDLIFGHVGNDQISGKGGGGDEPVGTENDDLIFGGPGDDRIAGLDGDDVIIADPGSAMIDGNEPSDSVLVVPPAFGPTRTSLSDYVPDPETGEST